MKNTIFTGMATALVTPMKPDGAIDYEAFARFIEFQIEKGINGWRIPRELRKEDSLWRPRIPSELTWAPGSGVNSWWMEGG